MFEGIDPAVSAWVMTTATALIAALAATAGYALLIKLGYRLIQRRAIARDFLETALDNYAVAPFRVPPGVRLVPIHRDTGEPGVLGQPGVILEAFRPGSEPSRTRREDESGLSFARDSVSDDPLAFLFSDEDADDEDEDEDDDLGGLY